MSHDGAPGIISCSETLPLLHPHSKNQPVGLVKRHRYRSVKFGTRFSARQSGRSVANDSPPLQCVFGAVPPRRKAANVFPGTRNMLRRNAAYCDIFTA